MPKKILFVNSNTHHLFGQQHLMRAFAGMGYEIILLMPDESNYFSKLANLGYKCVALKIYSRSLNPFKDLALLVRLSKYFKQLQPDIILSFTIKPNLFGAIAAWFTKTPLIANVTGLGYVFINKGFITRIAIMLYKIAFRKAQFIFCQNEDDFELLKQNRIFNDLSKVAVIPGSGVDLTKFAYIGIKQNPDIKFLYAGRLLWDKGLGELVAAFEQVRKKYKNIKLIFIGDYFFNNPAAIMPEQIEHWVSNGLIEYRGMVDNVSDVIAEVDCMILPSYREGMPRSLLEASSMGKPIITVDSIGCKNVVEDGVTGYMAKVRDVDSLAFAMLKFIKLPLADKIQMGINGRAKMKREFDQKIVIEKYMSIANELLFK